MCYNGTMQSFRGCPDSIVRGIFIMKHTKIAAALTAAMLLGSMTSAMPAIAEGGETLLSTGFEDGVGAWMGFGPADVSVSNNMWHEGKQCLYIGGRTEN